MKYLNSIVLAVGFMIATPAQAQQYETRTFFWDPPPPYSGVLVAYRLFWKELTKDQESSMDVPGDILNATVTTLPTETSYQVNVAAVGRNPQGVTEISGRSNTLCFGPACLTQGMAPGRPYRVRIIGN